MRRRGYQLFENHKPSTFNEALQFVSRIQQVGIFIDEAEPKQHEHVLRFLRKKLKQEQHPESEDLLSKLNQMIDIVSAPSYQMFSGGFKRCVGVGIAGIFWLFEMMQVLFYGMGTGCETQYLRPNNQTNHIMHDNSTALLVDKGNHYSVLGLYFVKFCMTTFLALGAIMAFEVVKGQALKLDKLYKSLPSDNEWPDGVLCDSHESPGLTNSMV